MKRILSSPRSAPFLSLVRVFALCFQVVVPEDVRAAIMWHAQRSPKQVLAEREKIMCRLEQQVCVSACQGKDSGCPCVCWQAAALWSNGDCEQWLANASCETKSLASTVNGPMLELLANVMGQEHKECVQFFREGMSVGHCV